MTVSYQYEVASSTSGGFTRLLLMWRGSLYKLIYRELLLFLILFGVISALYRHAFTAAQKKEFEQIVTYCDRFIGLIPLSFVLGFYVSYVAQRWWNQYQAIPWPDKVMHLVALYITGNDEYARMLRRSLMRYLNLSLILVLRSISSAVKRRFPTLDHVVDSGFMTSLELELYMSVPSQEFNTYWIPCTWFVNLLKEARRSHRLPDAQGLKLIMEEFNDFRSKCGLLWSYDWVSIPLVYTQVVTLATYSFFAVALVGRQYIEGAQKQFQMKIDIYLPIFTILQFFFFMGLLKVAEQLINPFGDDDEDFELNWLIDRHTKVSYLGVDTLMNRCPPLVRDIYFDSENLTLPYTEAAAAYKKKTYRGSVADMAVPEAKQTMFLPGIVEEEEEFRETATPRTSTVSLATTDSPVNNRRQISGSPPTTPKMAHNCSETVLQLDVQDSPSELEQPEQRRTLTDTVKKFSAMTRLPTPRIDQNRKPYFPLLKSGPKVMLEPWPSATNLSRPSEQTTETSRIGSTAERTESGPMPRRSSLKVVLPPPSSASSTEQKSNEDRKNFAGSSPSHECCEDGQDVCACNSKTASDSSRSDVCQFQCLHQDICQHLRPPMSTLDLLFADDEPDKPKVDSHRKYLVKRQSSTGSGTHKRKGVHWKPSFDSRLLRIRRKTVDNVPSVEKIIPCTRSSPNLTNLKDDATSPKDSEGSDETKEDSSSVSEDHAKL